MLLFYLKELTVNFLLFTELLNVGKITFKVFMLKLVVIFPKFHTSVKRKKLTFNSYNYNFFILFLALFLSFSLYYNIFC